MRHPRLMPSHLTRYDANDRMPPHESRETKNMGTRLSYSYMGNHYAVAGSESVQSRQHGRCGATSSHIVGQVVHRRTQRGERIHQRRDALTNVTDYDVMS